MTRTTIIIIIEKVVLEYNWDNEKSAQNLIHTRSSFLHF